MACTFLSLIQLFLHLKHSKVRNLTEKKDLKEYDDELLESGFSQSWAQAVPDSGPEDYGGDLEMKPIPKARASTKGKGSTSMKKHRRPKDSPPESPPEVTSVVRRRSSVGIQRQASVCLSDEEEQSIDEPSRIPEDINEDQNSPELPQKEITQVSAIVHYSCNERPPSKSWDQTSVCSSKSQPAVGVYHPPFTHSYSSPDSGNGHAAKQGPITNTVSLQRIPADTLTRVVDLEDYHYSRQQVWELAAQGATLLKDRSQSDLDVADDVSPIQEAASTEAGILEHGLEQHQLEHLRLILQRYSPVDEEDAKIWSKVRYNDTGSREDIREEVIEMISGESSDDSHGSIENEILKQQSKQLWELRASLEKEEDNLSDTQEAEEELLEEGQLDPRDILASGATSFESNPDISCDDPGYDCDESDYLQIPSHELRRHCYKSLLTQRLQKRTPGTESSYDSMESSSTDRTEGATTSFESTTDNTDSTGEGQTNRLQQMKADSGYKSMESKSMESSEKAPRLSKKQLQFNLEGESVDQMRTIEGTFEEEIEVLESDPLGGDTAKKSKSIEATKVVSFEGVTVEGEALPSTSESQIMHKKKYKSALKKHCTTGDFEFVEARGKSSLFQRFFRSGRLRLEQTRDYSIDEKSDALFREFSRHDSEGMRKRMHGRLHQRSTDPLPTRLSIEEEEGETHIPVICLSYDDAPV